MKLDTAVMPFVRVLFNGVHVAVANSEFQEMSLPNFLAYMQQYLGDRHEMCHSWLSVLIFFGSQYGCFFFFWASWGGDYCLICNETFYFFCFCFAFFFLSQISLEELFWPNIKKKVKGYKIKSIKLVFWFAIPKKKDSQFQAEFCWFCLN